MLFEDFEDHHTAELWQNFNLSALLTDPEEAGDATAPGDAHAPAGVTPHMGRIVDHDPYVAVMKSRYGTQPRQRKARRSTIERLADPMLGSDAIAALPPRERQQRVDQMVLALQSSQSCPQLETRSNRHASRRRDAGRTCARDKGKKPSRSKRSTEGRWASRPSQIESGRPDPGRSGPPPTGWKPQDSPDELDARILDTLSRVKVTQISHDPTSKLDVKPRRRKKPRDRRAAGASGAHDRLSRSAQLGKVAHDRLFHSRSELRGQETPARHRERQRRTRSTPVQKPRRRPNRSSSPSREPRAFLQHADHDTTPHTKAVDSMRTSPPKRAPNRRQLADLSRNHVRHQSTDRQLSSARRNNAKGVHARSGLQQEGVCLNTRARCQAPGARPRKGSGVRLQSCDGAAAPARKPRRGKENEVVQKLPKVTQGHKTRSSNPKPKPRMLVSDDQKTSRTERITSKKRATSKRPRKRDDVVFDSKAGRLIRSLVDGGLSKEQQQRIAEMEKELMASKKESCAAIQSAEEFLREVKNGDTPSKTHAGRTQEADSPQSPLTQEQEPTGSFFLTQMTGADAPSRVSSTPPRTLPVHLRTTQTRLPKLGSGVRHGPTF